ncbi:MAG: tetratricopeptide repeat protein [Deltaproteobacteria bacterium]|nr:tetratricopeptide repeat protein [Deltaproteobacteria bacterium]
MARGRELVMQGLLSLLIIAPALALGAVHPSVLAAFLIPAAALFIYLLVTPRIGAIRLDLPGALFLGLILFTLFQLIPLPVSLVKLLSEATYEVRSGALRPMSSDLPGFMPLTLDATFTVTELGKLILYLAVYWTCLLWTRRRGSKFVLNLVIGAGVLSAMVFLAHKILLLDKVYGLYAPIHVSFGTERSSAPLLNENHMAGFLGICAAVAIGRALSVHDRSKRILMISLAGILGGALLLTVSRAGIAAFVCGQCLFILLRVLQRLRDENRDRTPAHQHLAWLPIGLALSLGLGLFTAQDVIIGEFVHGDAKKLELVFEGLPLIGRFWTTGVGRGSFWVGFPLVSDLSATTTFTHAENAVVQILADWGMLVGAAALLSICYAVGRFLVKPPRRVQHVEVLAALVAFGLHNLVDFNMEVPGVAVLVVALLAVLQGNHVSSGKKRGVSRPVIGVLAVGAVAASATIGFYVGAYNLDTEERRYRQAFAERNPEPFSDESLKAALSRHPADWYLPFIVGVRHFQGGTVNPLPWLARSIELNRSSASAHLYVGRTFLKAGKLDQAMLEFRLASLFNPSFARHVANFLVLDSPSFKKLSKIAVGREDKALLWGALAGVFAARGMADEAEAADKAVLAAFPMDPRSLGRHANRLAGRGDMEGALELAHKLAIHPDYGPASARIQARIYEKHNQLDRAIKVLEKEVARSKKHTGLIRALALARQRAGDYQGALRAAAMLRALARSIESRASVALLEARLAVAEGRIQEALAAYRRAHTLVPSNLSVLRKIANLSEKQGDHRRAIEALRKLRSAEPDNASYDQRLKKLQNIGRGIPR